MGTLGQNRVDMSWTRQNELPKPATKFTFGSASLDKAIFEMRGRDIPSYQSSYMWNHYIGSFSST